MSSPASLWEPVARAPGDRYQVTGYKRVFDNGVPRGAAPCAREEAEFFIVEKQVGQRRWQALSEPLSEDDALGRLVDLTDAAEIERTLSGYSLPRV